MKALRLMPQLFRLCAIVAAGTVLMVVDAAFAAFEQIRDVTVGAGKGLNRGIRDLF